MKLPQTCQQRCANALLILSGILLILWSPSVNAQEYGLGFKGQPHSKDRRTQLDLYPGKYFRFRGEFELAFHMRIRDEIPSTFGYVCRIIDQDNNIVDLVFNGPKNNSLQVVYSDLLSSISVPDPDSGLFSGWTEIRLLFNLRRRTLEFSTPDTNLYETDVPLTGKVKIFFGRNTFDPVQTTDVPTMDLRDIRIFINNKCLYHFPLDELDGTVIKDVISGTEAQVQNPIWIRPKYYNWESYFSTYLAGFAAYCYAPDEDRLFLVGDRQMKVLSLQADSSENLEYSSGFSGLTPGSQVFYDSIGQSLYCYNHRDRTVFYFNFPDLRWEEITDGPDSQQRLWFHNKFYEPEENMLYLFGGYSQHRYSNLVIAYHLNSHQWDTVQTTGDVFYPRMHAALGYVRDTVYIMGGFGSTAGDQEINPKHYTDLMAFSLRDKRFVKKYDFDAPFGDIDFAHSMVFDQNGKDYYVLASSIYQYETYLQILKGSLSGPELTAIGTRIPYLFHNENSYADLFHSKSLQKLIAVTSLADREKSETKIEVHTLSYPPFPEETKVSRDALLSGKIFWILILLIVGAVGYFIVSRRIASKKEKSHPKKASSQQPVAAGTEQERISPSNLEGREDRNSIYFFGGFQVINRLGEDITRKFTPLLKELFLLIFLHSVEGKGISVPRLTELLWFSMSSKPAKNNRAVNIAKLKHLLTEIDDCSISRKTEYWKIVFDEKQVYSDYLVFHKLIMKEDEFSENDLENLLSIVKAGPLLGNASYEWLDEFKLKCSDRITDVLAKHLEHENISKNPELSVRIADIILIFDIMHEEGLIIKCKALTELGKHSLAREIFTKFSKDYQALYDEPYNKTFTDIIKR